MQCSESQIRAEEVQGDAKRLETVEDMTRATRQGAKLVELEATVAIDRLNSELIPLRREKQILLERVNELQVCLCVLLSLLLLLLFSIEKDFYILFTLHTLTDTDTDTHTDTDTVECRRHSNETRYYTSNSRLK